MKDQIKVNLADKLNYEKWWYFFWRGWLDNDKSIVLSNDVYKLNYIFHLLQSAKNALDTPQKIK